MSRCHLPIGPRSWLVAAVLVLVAGPRANAHEAGLSTLELVARSNWVEVVVQFSPSDIALLIPIDSDGNGVVSRAEFEAARPQLDTLAAKWLKFRAGDAPLTLKPSGAQYDEAGNNIVLRATVPTPPTGTWVLTLPMLINLPPDHRQYTIAGFAVDKIVAEKMITAEQPWLVLDWSAAPLAGARMSSPAASATPSGGRPDTASRDAAGAPGHDWFSPARRWFYIVSIALIIALIFAWSTRRPRAPGAQPASADPSDPAT